MSGIVHILDDPGLELPGGSEPEVRGAATWADVHAGCGSTGQIFGPGVRVHPSNCSSPVVGAVAGRVRQGRVPARRRVAGLASSAA